MRSLTTALLLATTLAAPLAAYAQRGDAANATLDLQNRLNQATAPIQQQQGGRERGGNPVAQQRAQQQQIQQQQAQQRNAQAQGNRGGFAGNRNDHGGDRHDH